MSREVRRVLREGGIGCSPVKDMEAPGEQEGLWDSLCLAEMGSGRRL